MAGVPSGTRRWHAAGIRDVTAHNVPPGGGPVSTVFLYETAGKPLAGSRAMVEPPGQARRLVARSRTAAGRQARDLWIKLRHRG